MTQSQCYYGYVGERKFAYLALLASAIIWGIAPPVIKNTLKYVSPVSFLFFRFLLASLFVLVPVIIKIKKTKPSKKEVLSYLFLGFLCTPLNLLLLFWGINKTTAIDASLISIVSPILVVFGGSVFLKEKVTLMELAGTALAVAGTLLIVIQPMLDSELNVSKNIIGNLLVLAGTFVWVIYTLMAKKQQKLDSFLLVGLSFIIGLLTIAPLYFLELEQLSIPFFTLNSKAFAGIAFMAIFSSIIAYWTYVYGLTKIEASEAVIFTYLQPVFSIPISVIFLRESLTLPFVIGAILIISGVVTCSRRKRISWLN